MYNVLSDYLSSRRFKFLRRYHLAQLSSIKMGGFAEFYIAPTSAKDFIDVIDFLYNLNIPYCVVGRATNTLFACDSFPGAVVSTVGMSAVSNKDEIFFADAGASLAAFMSYASRCGYGGGEQLWLVPGTLGGAIRGNAGAHGIEIADVLEYADVYFTESGELARLGRDELGFGYRDSLIKSQGNAYVVSAALRLSKMEHSDIMARRRGFLEQRMRSQPCALPSLGSIFKRINGISAGYYIEKAGLKGFRIGGAEVSQKHAGFIVNIGGATYRDVLELIRIVEERIYEKFGIMPEKEIEIIGKEV